MADENVTYVQLEPGAFLSDADFQLMTGEERGCYWTVILYLYRNSGKMKYEANSLSTLCNVKPDFDFKTVLSKFQIKRGYLYHKRVTREIKKAQDKKAAGLTAARARWNPQNEVDATAMRSHSDSNAAAMPIELNRTKDNNIHTHTPATGKFTLSEVKDAAVLAGLSLEQAEQFFNHYNSQGWIKANNLPITDLPSQLANWKQNNYKFEGKNNGNNRQAASANNRKPQKGQTAGSPNAGGGFENAFR